MSSLLITDLRYFHKNLGVSYLAIFGQNTASRFTPQPYNQRSKIRAELFPNKLNCFYNMHMEP